MDTENLKFFDAHQDMFETLPDPAGKPQTSFNNITRNCSFVVASIFVNPTTKPQNYRNEITKQLDFYLEAIKNNPKLFLVVSKKDLATQSQKTGIILHLEGLTHLHKKDIKFIRGLVEKGVRSFGLTWNQDNDFASSCLGNKTGSLTKLGRDFVRFCHSNNLVVDLAHAGKKTMADCMALGKPVIFSHGGCYTLCPKARNIDDATIKAISQLGGGIGIFAAKKYLTAEEGAKSNCFFQHIEYVIRLGGENAVGLGTDFGGIMSESIKTLANINDLPRAMYQWSGNDKLKEKVAYLNWLTIYRRIL